MKQFISFCIVLLISYSAFSQNKHTIHGTISELSSHEALIGANIFIPSLKSGIVTNSFGFYSIEIQSKDSVLLEFSFVGFLKRAITIKLDHDTCINVDLAPITLKGVVIFSESSCNSFLKAKPGLIVINNSSIHNTTALFGEHDVLSYLQLLPGISNSSESSNYFSVRGGGPDQNLIILDDANVYNSNHLFGYFSNLNDDIIKSVDVWKGSFPAKFGGKLSSVIDVRTKDGDKENFHTTFGIGVISTKISIEGPIKKTKSSYVLALRRSNLDFTLPIMVPSMTDYSRYHFLDVNFKLNFILNQNNRLYYSGYYGVDKFTEPGEYQSNYLRWYNGISSIRWNHIFSPKLFSNSTLVYSKFLMDNVLQYNDKNTLYFKYLTQIQQFALKNDFEYYPSKKTKISGGIQFDDQNIRPGVVATQGIFINNPESNRIDYRIFSTSVYGEFSYELWNNTRLVIGTRLCYFLIGDSISWSNEPRVSVAYKAFPNFNIITSYAKTSQAIHMLTNTGIGTPTDMWVPATSKLPIETGQQVSIGFIKDFKKFPVSITIEAYYKEMNNIIGYKPGATFLVTSIDPTKINIPDWQNNATLGKGTAYGTEILLKKETGRVTGLVSYTLSWAKQTFPEINYGETFYAPYDSRHKVSINSSYTLQRKSPKKQQIAVSCNWIYSSGKPITLPISQFDFHSIGYGPLHNGDAIEYGSYNGYRIKAFHRLDLSVKFTKSKPKYNRIWELGVYNVYNRINPYRYSLQNASNSKVQLSYISYFPILPYVTFTIKL